MRLFILLRYVWTHPLNAGNRVAAIVRVVRWQIGSRILPWPVSLPYVDDTRLLTIRGMAGATGNWYCGLHESSEMGFTLHVLRPTDRFIDVGANVGSFTVLAAGAVGARAVAVEPIPATYDFLVRNVALNGVAERVQCWEGGLSHTAGTLSFTDDMDTVNHVVAQVEVSSSSVVAVQTLDDLAGSDVPVLIKIDVEGHELAVLQGGTRTLADPRLLAVLLETNGSGSRYGISDSVLLDTMQGYGFHPYSYDPITRRLLEMQGRCVNTVFVRDLSAVNARLLTAPRRRLVNREI